MDKLKPCPFCGAHLVYEEYTCEAIPGKPTLRYYKHPKNMCFLDMCEVDLDEVPSWNYRTGVK